MGAQASSIEAFAYLMQQFQPSMEEPLVTVITPTYNAGEKLELTIESVLAQRRDLFEYIIVDGASTDGSVAIAQRYAGSLRLLSEPDKGVYDAMNKGIDLARGRFLYFLGAGDTLRPDAIEAISEHLQIDHPSFVYGDVFWVSDDATFAGKVYGGEFDRKALVFHSPCHQAIFYHRTIFEMHGKYDIRYRNAADWVLNFKCFGDDRIEKIYVNQIVADYEGGGVSATSTDVVFHRHRVLIISRYLGPYYAWILWREEVFLHRLNTNIHLIRHLCSKSPRYLLSRTWYHVRRKLGSRGRKTS